MADMSKDNGRLPFEEWIHAYQPYVWAYLRGNHYTVEELELSSIAFMALRMNHIHEIADLLGKSEEQIASLDYSSINSAREIHRKCNYFLRDKKDEIIEYVNFRLKKTDDNIEDIIVPSDQDNNLESKQIPTLDNDSDRMEFERFLEKHPFPIELLELSNRTYNCLKRAGINTLLQAVERYPNGFGNIRNMGQMSINELCDKIRNEADKFFVNKSVESDVVSGKTVEVLSKEPRSISNSFIEEEQPVEHVADQDTLQETKNAPDTLSFEDYLKKYDPPIENYNLSTRTYNCLKRNHINTLGDAILFYPDRLFKLRNMGIKSVQEIKTVLEHEMYLYSHGKLNYASSQEITNRDVSGDNNEPEDIYAALKMPKYRNKVYDFLKIKRIKLESLTFNDRVFNAVRRAGISDIVDLVKLYPDRLSDLRGLGAQSVNNLTNEINRILKESNPAFMRCLSGDLSSVFDDTEICEQIIQMYNEYKPFYGLSYAEIKAGLPEFVTDETIKRCVGSMIADHKIEYVDFRCYKVIPSFYSIMSEMSSDISNDSIYLLKEYYSGRTLDELGREVGVTRERVRQKTEKAMELISRYAIAQYGSDLFDEDYYSYVRQNYDISKEGWIKYIGVSKNTYNYLHRRYRCCCKSLEEALADDNVSVSLKMKILNLINKDKLKIDGRLFSPQRSDIEDYIASEYCKDEISYDEFCDLYNSILEKNEIPYDKKIYCTEEVKRTRQNRLAESNLILWKAGMRLRYYNIEERDYQELLDTIGIAGYTNTGLSTLYWINNYPDVMDKYDIRDQYELHNLLKKIIPEGSYNEIRFDRTPGITFGSFDRDQMIIDTMIRNSPISSEDLADIIYNEYGYDRGTSAAVYFKCIRSYYHNGMYSIDYKHIPDDNIRCFLSVLDQDFYFADEISKIYFGLFPDADRDEINPRSMQEIGFVAYTTYYLRDRWSSATEYFKMLLSASDVMDLSAYNKRYAYIQMYTGTLREMRTAFDLFTLKDGTAISIDRLSKVNVGKKDIQDYCESVERFVEDRGFFTIQSIVKDGFTSSLDNLGFDNSFYENILEVCGRFSSLHFMGTMVLIRGDAKGYSSKDFILAVLEHYDSISIDDLIDQLADEYGVIVKDPYKLRTIIRDTGYYYDDIMEKIYKNKEIYYDEL